jgi:DNA-binding transcriptional ArsR family regulator
MFGLGARAEILRQFLSSPEAAISIARLAGVTGYTKRNVAEECETLERAGVLRVRVVGNRFYYSLAREEELQAFVGELPETVPNWTALFHVADALARFDQQAHRLSQSALAVAAHRVLRDLSKDLDELGLKGPTPIVSGRGRATAVLSAFQEWAADTLSAWGSGRWPEDG